MQPRSTVSPNSPTQGDFPKLALVIPALLLVWALSLYPSVIQKNSKEAFLLSVSWFHLLKLGIVFYGLYILPGFCWLAWRAQSWAFKSLVSSRRLLFAFSLGCVAHVLGIYLQKLLHLPFQIWAVLICLAVSYGALLLLARWIPVDVLEGKPEPEATPFENTLVAIILGLALLLGWEMTLRARGSSLSLMGDGYPHMINYLGTLTDGPLPDALPFYSTFILNIHPMGFHAMLAAMKTLTPGILHIDLLRYFSVLMVPLFIACTMGLLRELAKSRLAAALGAAAAVFISGGGLSLNIPIVYFPWYWSLAWCLACGVFVFLLRGQWRSPPQGFWAGLVLGAGVLMHPFFAFRMGTIVAFWVMLEFLRNILKRGEWIPFLKTVLILGLTSLVMVALWIVPLVLRHGWEETYSYEYILKNFTPIVPEGVSYIRGFKEAHFGFKDLWTWSVGNAGILPLAFLPLGLIALWRRRASQASEMIASWILAMIFLILSGLLPNSYRYFEYLFFGLLALGVYGLDWLMEMTKGTKKIWIAALALSVFAFAIRIDFFPKYRRALELYGRTSLSEQDIEKTEAIAGRYLRSKATGTLDQDFGSYPGYLWSRQKKIWDIYVQNKIPKTP